MHACLFVFLSKSSFFFHQSIWWSNSMRIKCEYESPTFHLWNWDYQFYKEKYFTLFYINQCACMWVSFFLCLFHAKVLSFFFIFYSAARTFIKIRQEFRSFPRNREFSFYKIYRQTNRQSLIETHRTHAHSIIRIQNTPNNSLIYIELFSLHLNQFN